MRDTQKKTGMGKNIKNSNLFLERDAPLVWNGMGGAKMKIGKNNAPKNQLSAPY